jgi:hypothetical protein
MKKSAPDFLLTLRSRFEAHPERHKGLAWSHVEKALSLRPDAVKSLLMMEQSGGEPDVVSTNKNALVFMDCAAESPAGRRSLAYDKQGRTSRKDALATYSAVEMAADMGIELLTEEQYRYLQSLGTFDLKTSVWLNTPAEMRSLGGALFGDRRFNRVFVYHNGAQSFYAARGFRGVLCL